jgi:toxin ParE1/3/4
MRRYRLSAKAVEDLAGIATYTIETFGRPQARVYRDRLARTCAVIADNPEIGRLINAIDPPVRFFPSGSHIVVYRAEADSVLVLRFRHASEDWKDDPAGD